MITQQQIDYFTENGYLRYGPVLDMAEVEELRTALDKVIAIETAGGDDSEVEFKFGHRREAPMESQSEEPASARYHPVRQYVQA